MELNNDEIDCLNKALSNTRTVQERFVKIQADPASHGAVNGFTAEEQKILTQLVDRCGELNIAGEAILERAST